jgi:phosphoribosylformylglycinamidine (FGAM) synthase-like enzyme
MLLPCRSTQAGENGPPAVHSTDQPGTAAQTQALAESCLRRGFGATIQLPADPPGGAFGYLFSESAGRALVSVPLGREKAFSGLCAERGLPWTALGVVGNVEGPLKLVDHFEIPLEELRTAWSTTLPKLFDHPAPGTEPIGDPE